MHLKRKIWKKVVCFGVALNVFAASFLWQAPLQTKAEVFADGEAEVQKITLEDVREEAAASYAGSEKMGFDINFEQAFTGTGQDYSADNSDRHYMQVFNNLKNSTDDQTVIIRFKTTNQNGFLFGAGTDNAGNGKNMVFALKGGTVRVLLRNVDENQTASAGLKGTFGSGYADGKYHTLAVSFLPSKGFVPGNVLIVVDGGTDIYEKSWGATHKVGFNQNEDAYTKFEVADGSYATSDACNGAAFNGEIDFLTIINKAYNLEQLQRITKGDKDNTNFSNMFVRGTCNTWLFTGGTEGVADFASVGTTRNWVGLFEDKMRDAGSFVERGRFVFNTSKRDADVAQILEEYDTRITPFGTQAVGIMVGAKDYEKGLEGIEEFKENLQTLLDKIIDDNKMPLLLSPYPSAKSEDSQNIALYTEAILEVAGTRVKVVDLSGLAADNINENSSLTARGHQTVANLIKDAVGTNTKTNHNFSQLSGGSYTVAKQNESGGLAQIAEVTAGESSITVQVEEDPAGPLQLEYTLTDESGTEISASAEGEEEFTIDGLKPCAAYILKVYDVSRGNVRESYQPVKITVSEGEKGVHQEYEEQNLNKNDKIYDLITGEKPATYLFMGDSITHGIVTNGYDSVPQMFAKYLDEIGRTDDVVLNTGVSNATIATTLDQIEPRLMRYNPDVVMIMLGTNDVSYNGENVVENGVAKQKTETVTNPDGTTKTVKVHITVDEYKDRYKELVRKIYENNAESSVVLRVPCEMLVDEPHRGYEELFEAIYDVAEEMRQEIPGLNIMVVNHRQAWVDYQNNVRNDNVSKTGKYAWLVDNVHPNGRGNLAMFQQIVKELGIYVNTSELANYQYELDDWSETSQIRVSANQRATRADVAMGSLSGYANKLKTVTLTLTADGRSISKTAEYSEDGKITVSGLDKQKEYEVSVTGKDAVNSKEITFDADLVQDSDTSLTEEEQKEYEDCLEEAAISGDTLGYPQDLLAAYEQKLLDIQEKYKSALTIDNLDEALAEIRAAKQAFLTDLDNAKDSAEKNLSEALLKSEKTYQEQKHLYNMLQGWNAYQTAYQNAKAADKNTDINTLRRLLKELGEAEKKLKEEKERAEADAKKPEEKIEEGNVYEDGDYSYKVISISKQTVEIAGVANGKAPKKITVGNEVQLKGAAYKIVSVGKNAFANNKTATSVVIGKNVETIGAQAFMRCTKLKSVTINSKKLTEIGTKAFFKAKNLNKIVIKSTSLKKAGKNAFKGTAKKLTIKVPKTKFKKYKRILAKKGQGKKAVIKK